VPTPGAHRLDEFQPVIPWRVALPQSPPPLHRPASECDKVVLPVEIFAANGKHGLNCLSQPRGQPQTIVYWKPKTCFLQFDNIFWQKGRQSGVWRDWISIHVKLPLENSLRESRLTPNPTSRRLSNCEGCGRICILASIPPRQREPRFPATGSKDPRQKDQT